MSSMWIGLIGGLIVAVGASGTFYALFRARSMRDKAALELDRQKNLADIYAALIESKDQARRLRDEADDEIRRRRTDLELHEARLQAREEAMKAQEAEIPARQHALEEAERAITQRLQEAQAGLERLANLSPEEAKAEVLADAAKHGKDLAANRVRQIQTEAIEHAERKAKETILNSIQRLAVDYTIEATTAVIQIPSEDIKGRLIGREGRNIRTFEQVTGVDLIIDESPDHVVVSSFDPVRREVARLTVMNLMLDGRIHPGRIEELYEKAKAEVERTVLEAGEDAADRAGVSGISAGTLRTLGRLRFRASYAQNVLDHSVEVAELCKLLAQELGFNVEVAKRAGLLHDIGKALGPEWEGPHAVAGMNYLQENGEVAVITHAVGAHHYEIQPETPEAQIVIVADAISASRPGARRESLDQYTKRLTKLEEIANSFPGVERSYAIQAGREIRLVVKPELVDDAGAMDLADQVARKIETDLEYPGQIKVTVIREIRAQQTAK